MKPDAALRLVHVANGSRHIVNVYFSNVLGTFTSCSGPPRGKLVDGLPRASSDPIYPSYLALCKGVCLYLHLGESVRLEMKYVMENVGNLCHQN